MSTIFVCLGRECWEKGSEAILALINKEVPNQAVGCRCLGDCERGVNIHANGKVIFGVTGENVFGKIRGGVQEADARKEDKDLDVLFEDL